MRQYTTSTNTVLAEPIANDSEIHPAIQRPLPKRYYGMHGHGNIDLRFKVVLFPLSLCPSSKTLIVFRLRFRLSDSRSILSILSLRFLASCSALSLFSRSSWVSLGGGWSATVSGSDVERRLGVGCCAVLFMMEYYERFHRGVQGLQGDSIPARRALCRDFTL